MKPHYHFTNYPQCLRFSPFLPTTRKAERDSHRAISLPQHVRKVQKSRDSFRYPAKCGIYRQETLMVLWTYGNQVGNIIQSKPFNMFFYHWPVHSRSESETGYISQVFNRFRADVPSICPIQTRPLQCTTPTPTQSLRHFSKSSTLPTSLFLRNWGRERDFNERRGEDGLEF